ncbi:MAG: cation transporter [Bacillus sp. (in: Bacteria)]|nr:cation transporter [Bacillus sp. (in: firmicutes)]
MKTVIFKMEPFSCPTCAEVIERVLKKQEGVKVVKVQFFSNKVKVSYNEDFMTSSQIEEVLVKLGYSIVDKKVAS